jgi:queuine tRNA-ribosyltransferase
MERGQTVLELPHGTLWLPAFLPDATLGVVRAVDASDLEACGTQALVMNTFHLMQRPGSSTVRALGGLHAMSGWRRPIVTDSGGFQAYSLIRENSRYGQITEDGITFRPEGADRRFQLTPEKAIQLQLSYGTDVVVCLDDCTHVDAPQETQEVAVRRTIDWARRGKREFERLVAQKGLAGAQRPWLFAVIQGGGSRELRRRCADALLEVGFDGFGYGGWPLDAQGRLLSDILAYTRALVPLTFPLHALGVGHPVNVVECARMGYELFDSALPTRDARHGRLYAHATGAPAGAEDLAGDWLSHVYIGDDRYIKESAPVSPTCDCLCCSHYSAGYLHHLFKIGDSLFMRLATLHNLRFMMRLCDSLRELPNG